jgi:prolyl oligopeptidase
MTQRPDLVKVAITSSWCFRYVALPYIYRWSRLGLRLRYIRTKLKKCSNTLKGYSPVHNVKAEFKYPATMVTTGDHDDRVVPAHSFKFAAELQAKQAGNNPTLIRIDVNAGHGAGKSLNSRIQESADVEAFILYSMGIMSLK